MQIGFTFLVLSFWCQLIRVVQEGRKTVVCVFVCVTGALARGGLGWTRPPHFFPRVFLGLSRCGAY